MTLEMIRHSFMGAEYGEVLCFDKACHSNAIGPKILAHYHKGYGMTAKPATDKNRRLLDDSIRDHNRNHRMKMFIGHRESLMEGEYSKVVYEKGSE